MDRKQAKESLRCCSNWLYHVHPSVFTPVMSPEKLCEQQTEHQAALEKALQTQPCACSLPIRTPRSHQKTALFMIPVSRGEGYRVKQCLPWRLHSAESRGREHMDSTCPLPVEPWVALLFLAMRCDNMSIIPPTKETRKPWNSIFWWGWNHILSIWLTLDSSPTDM